MRFDGVIRTWDEERGVGTIDPLPDGDPIALHIAAVVRGQPRPRVKQRVSFEVELSHDGRKRAAQVRIHETVRPPRTPSRSVVPGDPAWPGVLAVLLFLACYATATVLWKVAPAIGIGVLALSLLALGIAAQDKGAARRHRTRLADQLWLLLALLGGWPGLVLAPTVLGHWPGRRLARGLVWAAALAHVGAFAFLVSPWGRALR